MPIHANKLKIGPMRQKVLPTGFIARVQGYKEILKEVEPSTLEEAISNFQRDLDPESELKVWEGIARTYKEVLKSSSEEMNLASKKEVFSAILLSSMETPEKEV